MAVPIQQLPMVHTAHFPTLRDIDVTLPPSALSVVSVAAASITIPASSSASRRVSQSPSPPTRKRRHLTPRNSILNLHPNPPLFATLPKKPSLTFRLKPITTSLPTSFDTKQTPPTPKHVIPPPAPPRSKRPRHAHRTPKSPLSPETAGAAITPTQPTATIPSYIAPASTRRPAMPVRSPRAPRNFLLRLTHMNSLRRKCLRLQAGVPRVLMPQTMSTMVAIAPPVYTPAVTVPPVVRRPAIETPARQVDGYIYEGTLDKDTLDEEDSDEEGAFISAKYLDDPEEQEPIFAPVGEHDEAGSLDPDDYGFF